MPLARCEKCGRPDRRTSPYATFHNPASDPNKAVVCGARGCEQPARIWLTTEEQKQYLSGRRVFAFATNSVKVRIA
jgi:hypothetical protein